MPRSTHQDDTPPTPSATRCRNCLPGCPCRARSPRELMDSLARFYGIPIQHTATLLAGFRSYGWELTRTTGGAS